MATLTLQLHLDAEHNPILPEGFGAVPVAVNGKRYRATVSRTLTDETGTKIHLWMEPDGVPGGPDGPVLLTLDELCRSDPHPQGMAAYGPCDGIWMETEKSG